MLLLLLAVKMVAVQTTALASEFAFKANVCVLRVAQALIALYHSLALSTLMA
jgi:hypothetical protein